VEQVEQEQLDQEQEQQEQLIEVVEPEVVGQEPELQVDQEL
jgi:hypothetical protein